MLNLGLSYVNRYEQLLLNPVHTYYGLRPSSKQHVFFGSCKSHCAQLLSSCARKPLRHSSPCISKLARATHLLPSQLFSETTVTMQCVSFQRWVVNPQSFCWKQLESISLESLPVANSEDLVQSCFLEKIPPTDRPSGDEQSNRN